MSGASTAGAAASPAGAPAGTRDTARGTALPRHTTSPSANKTMHIAPAAASHAGTRRAKEEPDDARAPHPGQKLAFAGSELRHEAHKGVGGFTEVNLALDACAATARRQLRYATCSVR